MSHLQVIQGRQVMGMGLADFIWLDEDGEVSWKKRAVLLTKNEHGDTVPVVERQTIEYCPCEDECDCDGENNVSLVLSPVHYLPDPTRPQPNFLVLCEVKDGDDKPVEWNQRAVLREAMKKRGDDAKLMWFGFEQDYCVTDARSREFDREPAHDYEERKFLAAERHLGACFDAGLLIHSTQGYPGSWTWEFKVGYRGFPNDLDPNPPTALVVADHLVIARYLMHKINAGKGLIPVWSSLSPFVSSADMRGGAVRSIGRAEADMMMDALEDMGQVRLLPHPTRGGTRCITVQRDEPADPYELALEVLAAVMPLEDEDIVTTAEPTE